MFNGHLGPDTNGETRVEGFFELHPLPVLLVHVSGIGGGLLMLVENLGVYGELRQGLVLAADRLPQLLIPFALIAFGIWAPAVARLLASGTEAFLLDFLRKSLLAQPDKASDLPVLDSMMR